MKLKVLVRFEGVIGYPNNTYSTIVSAEGVDKADCYQKVHQRCMNIADEIERDQCGCCATPNYIWVDEEWE